VDSVRRSTAGPVLAGISGLVVGWAFNLIVTAPSWVEAPRLAALLHLCGESAVVLTVFALVATACGGIRRDDLSLFTPRVPII
jgi:hypothetical protein